jgi:hypothetical protein
MKLTLEFDDEGAVYELMDSIVLTHLKSTKKSIQESDPLIQADVDYDANIIAAIDVLIKYLSVASEE